MANTRDIRRRIKSVKNTAQITKAMQMVAASRMRKAQNQALAGRAFQELMEKTIANLAENVVNFSHPLLEKQGVSPQRTALLVITSDRGLCGALNHNLLRELAQQEAQLTGEISYVTVGRKGRQYLARKKANILADFEIKDNFTFQESRRISAFLLERFEKKEINAVKIIYSRFVNTVVQQPTLTPLVPIGLDLKELVEERRKKAQQSLKDAVHPNEVLPPGNFLFEPEAPQLLAFALPRFVHNEVYQMLLNAKASEHSARMVAMKNATDNAKQLIKDLTLEYNKVRQAAITTELLEMTTAQMALD